MNKLPDYFQQYLDGRFCGVENDIKEMKANIAQILENDIARNGKIKWNTFNIKWLWGVVLTTLAALMAHDQQILGSIITAIISFGG